MYQINGQSLIHNNIIVIIIIKHTFYFCLS